MVTKSGGSINGFFSHDQTVAPSSTDTDTDTDDDTETDDDT